MKTDNGRSVSLWMATQDTPAGAQLPADTHCDVCVIGSGIAGLSTAYLLNRAGKKVIVLDDGPTAGGESARTSAHLVYYNDDGMVKIEKLHGTEGLRLATDSHAAAVDKIESIAREEKIDCNFYRVSGYLFPSPDGEGVDWLEKELDVIRRIGRTDVHFVDRAPLPRFDSGRYLCYPNLGQFHPLKYLAGVASAFRRAGGLIVNDAHVVSVEGGNSAQVRTADGKTVEAGAVVVATNSPINDRFVIHSKLTAFRTFVIGMKIRKGVIPRGLYWDTMDPYHYVRLAELDDANEVLLVGGEDHKTGRANDADRRYEAIEAWAEKHFPDAGEVMFRWSGQVMETLDFLAYIGRNPDDEPNVFIATGDSGMGLTHGTVAGMLLTDLILGRENPWEKLYAPNRLHPRSALAYLEENAQVMKEYTAWATGGEVDSVDEIPADGGAIVRQGVHKIAAYRDPHGTIHEFSAVCPHLKCLVAWNSSERTWDCPCHGSRFTATGIVCNGPSAQNLSPADEKKNQPQMDTDERR